MLEFNVNVDENKCLECVFFNQQLEKEKETTMGAFDLALSMRYFVETCPYMDKCPQMKGEL